MKPDTNLFREKRTVNTVCKFNGINSLPSASDGDIAAAFNICSDKYPSAAASQSRRILCTLTNGDFYSTVGADENLFYTCKTDFIYDGKVKGEVSPYCRKNFAILNDTITIFPDKKYYRHGRIIYRYCDGDLVECTNENMYVSTVKLIAVSNSAPSAANEGDKYYKPSYKKLFVYTDGQWVESGTPDVFTRYSLDIDEFGALDAEYVWNTENSTGYFGLETVGDDGGTGNTNLKFSFYKNAEAYSPDFSSFNVGDTISITGVSVLDGLSKSSSLALSEGTVITEIGDTYITVKNTIGASDVNSKQSPGYNKVIFKRIVPYLSCAMRVGDRIWGAHNSTVYACAPNKPQIWGNGSSISEAVTIDTGVPGNIIGCADYGGVPVFFTENAIIKVLRVYNGYKISVTPAPSLSADSPGSVAFVYGALYYVSDSGVMCYKGGIPSKVKCNLSLKFLDAVGGTDGCKYYLSNGTYTYIFDPFCQTWYREYGKFISFARLGGNLVGIGYNYTNFAVYKFPGKYNFSESDLELEEYVSGNPQIIFAPFYEGTHQKKTFTKLILKTYTGSSDILNIYVSFDSGAYEFVGSVSNKTGIAVTEFPLRPVRANYMQVKIQASGQGFSIISLSREFITHDDYN